MPRIAIAGWAAVIAVLTMLNTDAAGQRASVDDNTLKQAGLAGENWLTYGRDQSETRFSPLRGIDTSNVSRLHPEWSYDVGSVDDGQEATPLAVNGTVYGITNWSVVFAVDGRTGKEKWRWDPWVNREAVRPVICCGVVNRGLAIYRGLIIAPVIDGRLQALDAETGRVVWEARVAFPQDGYTLTMAPRIGKGRVIIGASGGDFPTRGFFDAYDALTGRRAWRFYTVPGDPSKEFKSEAMRVAAKTWDREWWKSGGGGAVWDGMAYDPAAGLLYVGTGNPQPWPLGLRSSKGLDNLYTSSILAVDIDTGQLKWHFQVVPGDNWDYDSVQQLVLADLAIGGRTRKVLMQASKNGFFYVIDRITGQFISAEPFAVVSWAKGVDPKTGRPIVNDQAYYGAEAILLSPSYGGAHNWAPMAFNPVTGLLYIPISSNSSAPYVVDPNYDPTSKFKAGGGTTTRIPPGKLPSPPAIGPAPSGGTGRAIVAWDAVKQQMRWRAPDGGPTQGGVMTTAGNLVVQVVSDGRLVIYSADKGEKLLDMATGLNGGMGPPITYSSAGKQYIALMAGPSVQRGRGSLAAAPTSAKLLAFAVAD